MINIIEIIDGVPRQVQYTLPQPINIAIGKGEHVAIVGANGSGKSTIVGAMIGAIPLKGCGVKYNFDGDCSARISGKVKYLAFRDSYGTSDKSYFHQQRWNSCGTDNQPKVVETLPQSDNKALEEQLFTLFDIETMLNKEVVLLSSGELRKYQLVKALLSNPKVLILEDPFIGLDTTAREQLRELLDKLTQVSSMQMILVLSRHSDIPTFATHIVEVENGVCHPKVERCGYKYNNSIKGQALSDKKRKMIEQLPTIESPHKQSSIIELQNISIKYGPHTILRELTWKMEKGEQWALSGQNGAGKSTLLSLICADIPQGYACDIKLFGRKRGSGESIWDIKRHIGYVSPEMHRAYCQSAPCVEIVASGLYDTIGLYKKMREEQRTICQFWLDIFGIGHLSNNDFTRISSGEQRLVLLARAFVKDPELLILDEPLHGLDERNRRLAVEVVECFCRRANKSLIYVSHYKEELPTTITHSLHLTKVRD